MSNTLKLNIVENYKTTTADDLLFFGFPYFKIISYFDSDIHIWDSTKFGISEQVFSNHSDDITHAIKYDDKNFISCSLDKTILTFSLDENNSFHMDFLKVGYMKERLFRLLRHDLNHILCLGEESIFNLSYDENGFQIIQRFEAHLPWDLQKSRIHQSINFKNCFFMNRNNEKPDIPNSLDLVFLDLLDKQSKKKRKYSFDEIPYSDQLTLHKFKNKKKERVNTCFTSFLSSNGNEILIIGRNFEIGDGMFSKEFTTLYFYDVGKKTRIENFKNISVNIKLIQRNKPVREIRSILVYSHEYIFFGTSHGRFFSLRKCGEKYFGEDDDYNNTVLGIRYDVSCILVVEKEKNGDSCDVIISSSKIKKFRKIKLSGFEEHRLLKFSKLDGRERINYLGTEVKKIGGNEENVKKIALKIRLVNHNFHVFKIFFFM